MIQVASIPDSEGARSLSASVPATVIEAQVYASFSLQETLTLSSLTVFPATFDVRAGAAVVGVSEAQFAAALKDFLARGVISTNLSAIPPLFQLAAGVRDLLVKLSIGQEAIAKARERHDEYFLALLIARHEESEIALDNAPHREFKKANLELVARRQIRRHIGLPPRAAGRPHGLTHRQWQVAQLVAAGQTNFQIAQEMGISQWTVVNHLRVVMRRMGCSSRVDVARIVLS